jgi:hypothetical protein
MPRLQARLFDAPDELRTFPLARIEMVKLDEDAGAHELKGLPGERRLYRVRERS